MPWSPDPYHFFDDQILARFDPLKAQPADQLDTLYENATSTTTRRSTLSSTVDVQLTSFMAPLRSTNDVAEFLLVPYFPTCIHAQPPPATRQ